MVYYLIPLLVFAGGQVYKVISLSIAQKKFSLSHFGEYGGMPSTHSSMVASLSTVVGVRTGFDSALFGITIVTALIIIHDAARLRRLIGRQSELLNQLPQEHSHSLPVKIGHTWPEIFLGVAYGIIASILLLNLF